MDGMMVIRRQNGISMQSSNSRVVYFYPLNKNVPLKSIHWSLPWTSFEKLVEQTELSSHRSLRKGQLWIRTSSQHVNAHYSLHVTDLGEDMNPEVDREKDRFDESEYTYKACSESIQAYHINEIKKSTLQKVFFFLNG